MSDLVSMNAADGFSRIDECVKNIDELGYTCIIKKGKRNSRGHKAGTTQAWWNLKGINNLSAESYDKIRQNVDELYELGVLCNIRNKKRQYKLHENGNKWWDLVNEVKLRPENAGKNMRDIIKMASAERALAA